MDISDEALEHSLDDLIEDSADFLDIETEEMLLEENLDSNQIKNKISKDQTSKKKFENSMESKQNIFVKSQTKNIKKAMKQENSILKIDSAKQNTERWNSIRSRNRNRKWSSRGNNYRRHLNYFEPEHNIKNNYHHNNRNTFDNFLTTNLSNNSCFSSNTCRMNMEMNCVNLNNRPNFLTNFENNPGNFMIYQQPLIKSNELINLIRYSSQANLEAINRLNIYKLELISSIAAKLFDVIDFIQTV